MDNQVLPAGWRQEDLERIGACPVCGANERITLHEGLRDNIFFSAPGSWTMYRCCGCRSAYVDPRPHPDEIHRAYRSYYTHTRPYRLNVLGARPLPKLVRALINDYVNSRYGSEFGPAMPLGRAIVRALPNLRRKLDRRLRYLPKRRPGARLLDVGFGSGAFLDMAGQVGWEVFGVDSDPVTVESARQRGLDVSLGGIEKIKDRHELFDAITLNHVIEHLHDPKKALSQAYDLLKPGGCLYLETPNADAVGHRIYGPHWRGLEPPRHLVLFTWSSLEKLVLDVGFARFSRLPQYQMYPDLAAKSRALQSGSDPYEKGIIRATDHFRGFVYSLITRVDNKHSEFITLICYK